MEDAAVHAVDGLAGTPALIFVLGALAIMSIVAIKVIPIWKDLRSKQLDIERDREIRKMSEAKMRNERELETAAINARSVDAQERATAAMSALTQQMAVMNGQLEMSKERSARMAMAMGETAVVVEDMAEKVDEIHGIVVRKEQ